MPDATRTSSGAISPEVDRWLARPMKPSFVLPYLAVFFAALITLAVFLFNSIAGIMSLAVTAAGTSVALLADLAIRIEYRLSESGVEKRRVRQQNPVPFKEIFRFPDLDYIVPKRYGFKYYKKTDSTSPLRDSFKRRFSEELSGEVYLDDGDRERILAHLTERGVATKSKR